MAWYTAVFLGLLQGLAEFLPISSSGHLLLFENWFGIQNGGRLLTLTLHLATLLAVVIIYRQRLWQLIRHPWNRETLALVIATITTCAFVVIFHNLIDRLFTVAILPFAFIATGIYLFFPTVFSSRKTTNLPTQPSCPTWWQALVVGCAQGIAVVPGLSRSGFTITTGRLTGMTFTESTDFSFIMSIPIIVASFVYEFFQGGSMQTLGFGNIVLAFVTAFVAGVVAIKTMQNLMRKIDLRWFSVYLWLLGVGLLLLNLL